MSTVSLNIFTRSIKINMKKISKIFAASILMVFTFAITVFAGTYISSENVKGKTNYLKEYEGSVGRYIASSDGINARTTVTNISNSGSKLFYNSIVCYNYNANLEISSDTKNICLVNGGTNIVSTSRNKNSSVLKYIHTTKGFPSTSSASGFYIDYFEFTGKQ